jgi:arsenate reductase
MNAQFLCYPPCSTCKKARQWLDDNSVAYTERHIRDQNPSADELRAWIAASGLPLKRFFNTSGMLYRSMNLSEKLPAMSEDEILNLLASDGMLVKRPLLIARDTVLVGFRQAEWDTALR